METTINSIKKVLGAFWLTIWKDQDFIDAMSGGYAQDATQLAGEADLGRNRA